MRPGTVLGGRWTVEGELPAQGELRRWAVTDGALSGEAVTPAAHVLMRPGVRDGFLRGGAAENPASLAQWDSLTHDGAPYRIRGRTRRTLEGLALTSEQAIAAAGWIGAAVLQSGGAALGELGPEDLVIDPDGVLRFAPTGMPRVESVARRPHTRAPEGSATAEADLYGLGATLFRAITGRWPERDAPVRAAPQADPILSALLAADPEARRVCVETLPAEPVVLAPEEPAFPALPPARVAGGTGVATPGTPPVSARVAGGTAIAVTTTTQPPAAAPPAPWVVLVPLAGLSTTALATLAARSSATLAALESAARRGETWAVDGAPTEAEAGRILARLEASGIKGRLTTTAAPKVIQYVLLATVAAIIAAVSGLWPVFGILAVILLYFAAVNLRGMFAVANTRLMLAQREQAALPDHAPESRLRALRQRISAAELPEIVLSDLRADVGTLERRIDEARGQEAELRGASASDLTSRQARVTEELRGVEQAIDELGAQLTRALTAELEEPQVRRELA